MIDLDNPPVPAGGALITLTARAFQYWMQYCGFERGAANVNQEVYFIHSAPTQDIGGRNIHPNWHITAMTTYRGGGDCINFHFKVEIGKSASHYWYYVIYRDVNGKLVWVGDPNPHIPATNEGGGGAAANIGLLRENKTLAISQARIHGIDRGCNKTTQCKMITKLQQLIVNGRLMLAADRIDRT